MFLQAIYDQNDTNNGWGLDRHPWGKQGSEADNIQTSCGKTELVPHPSHLQAHSDARYNLPLSADRGTQDKNPLLKTWFKIPQVTNSVAHTSHNFVLVIASDLVMRLLTHLLCKVMIRL